VIDYKICLTIFVYSGLNGPAQPQTNLPATCYQAVITASNSFDNLTGSAITGTVTGSAVGTGVSFTVNLTGFPAEAEFGPFGKFLLYAFKITFRIVPSSIV
jgi:hypothetical protein